MRGVAAIAAQGVPNYFGEQRFGRDGANVERARAMFAGKRVQRHERSLLLSSARSFLFNGVLAARVERGDWNVALPGEVWMLAGTHSVFGPEPLTPDLSERFACGDIGLTGPLWGSGDLRSTAAVAGLERAIADACPDLSAGLAAQGLSQERRALALRPRAFQANWMDANAFELKFYLTSGSYATVIIRELIDVSHL